VSTKVIHRRSDNGQICTERYADKHPKTTERQHTCLGCEAKRQPIGMLFATSLKSFGPHFVAFSFSEALICKGAKHDNVISDNVAKKKGLRSHAFIKRVGEVPRRDQQH
jgi:hypothetical protein